ncbi:MAG TPA: hypothetical protein ENJ24_02320 [Gammaproteobacteria bacterium]|nr:hypothetical protein [Gammaproteobacteria bacterium]
MNIFRFGNKMGWSSPNTRVSSTAISGGLLILILLGGCQDGKSASDSSQEVLKKLYPPVVDVVRNTQPEDAYFSYDSDKGIYYRAVPGFVWQGVLADVDNQFADPAAYDYAGFAMQVETNENRPDLEQICSSSVAIALYPPAATATGTGVVFDPVAGLGNSSVTGSEGQCGNDYFRLRALDDDGDGAWDRFQYSFPPGESSEALLTDATQGGWQLRNGAMVLANFELPPLSPVENGEPQVLVPVPRINRDLETGLVDSVDIRWWHYNSITALYEPVYSDEQIYRSAVALLDIRAVVDGETREEYQAYGLADRAVFPKYPWKVIDGADVGEDDTRVTAVQISYQVDGVAYRFIWRVAS